AARRMSPAMKPPARKGQAMNSSIGNLVAVICEPHEGVTHTVGAVLVRAAHNSEVLLFRRLNEGHEIILRAPLGGKPGAHAVTAPKCPASSFKFYVGYIGRVEPFLVPPYQRPNGQVTELLKNPVGFPVSDWLRH